MQFLEIPFPFYGYVLLLIRIVMGGNFLFGRGIRHLLTQRNETILRWKERGVPAFPTFLAGILNFLGAIFLIIGLVVPIVAIFFAIEMAVTAVMQKKKLKVRYFGHDVAGYEINIVYILICLILVTFGAGNLSIDALIGF